MPNDALTGLVPNARSFLRELATQNTREWFAGAKPRYEADLKRPSLILLDQVAADLTRLTGQPASTKLFRPHRDVRFSKDKTPYHTHLHMLWTTGASSWFFGFSPKYISIGGGVFAFDKPTLMAWRAMLNGDQGAVMADLIAAQITKGARLDPPELKRVPPPYPKDHPQGTLLRRKGLAVWYDTVEADIQKDGLINTIMAAFSELLPVQNALCSLH